MVSSHVCLAFFSLLSIESTSSHIKSATPQLSRCDKSVKKELKTTLPVFALTHSKASASRYP